MERSDRRKHGLKPLRAKAQRVPVERGKFKWPERLAKLLGKISDKELARRAGVHQSTVLKERRRRGIAPFVRQRRPIEWTDEMTALLGTAPDTEVAAELGVPARSVMYKRHLLGIPAYFLARARKRRSSFWTPDRIAQLGKLSDAELARLWGISKSAVHARRRILGIPASQPAPVPLQWTERMRSALGRDTDPEVARQLGISVKAVRRERWRLGIPPFRPFPMKVVRSPALRQVVARSSYSETMEEAGIGKDMVRVLRREFGLPVKGPVKWTQQALAKLGRVPDEQLAVELGCAASTVTRKRCSRGIRQRRASWWTEDEDELVRTLPPPEVAARTGRTLSAVFHRRQRLGVTRRVKSRRRGGRKGP